MARFASSIAVAFLLIAAAYGQTSPSATGALCNTDGTSANVAFSTSGNYRVITTNMCPNHAVRTINPNAARQNSFFGVSDQKYQLPLKPQLASTANIVNVTCIPGPIGFMRSGAVMFSVYAATYCGDDAVKLESKTFDECNGHSEQSGMYHYHMTPGCTLTSAGYSSTAHSPILGYMLDGIPIYGPLSDKGALPTDLDSCGGHSSDSGNNGQYHYHMKPVTGSWPDPSTPTTSTTGIGGGWPYTPGCLRGCIDTPYLNFFSGQSAVKYSSFAACAATGGTVLSNVESITSATAGPATTTASTTTTATTTAVTTTAATTTAATTTAATTTAVTTTTTAPAATTLVTTAVGGTTTTPTTAVPTTGTSTVVPTAIAPTTPAVAPTTSAPTIVSATRAVSSAVSLIWISAALATLVAITI